MRWIRIGAATSAPPATTLAGFRKSSSMGPSLGRCLQRRAMVQELEKHGVEAIACAHQRVVDALARAAASNLHEVFVERFQVAVAQRPRIAQQVRQRLHPFEARAPRERKSQLVLVEN